MLILGIDTTTLSCSVALLRNDYVLAEQTLNVKKTHSEMLMPLLDSMLNAVSIEREELDAIAVAAGPGSFTGLRIGLSTARALAQGLNIPAVAVSTLAALAEAVYCTDSLICPLLDARRNQVYTALYRRLSKKNSVLEPVIDPVAIDIEDLINRLKSITNDPIIFTGEGLHAYSAPLQAGLDSTQALITPAPFRVCRASFVALHGWTLLQQNPHSSYEQLLPIYLRQPEAERLAAERQGGDEQ